MATANVMSGMDALHVIHAKMLLAQRDALAAGDTAGAKEFRKHADEAKRVTKAAAKKHLGPEAGGAISQQVDTLDARHKRLVKATGGKGLLDVIAQGGEKGKEAKDAFDALAHGDALAKRVLNANLQAIKAGNHATPAAASKLAQFLPTQGAGTGLTPAVAQTILRKYIAVRGAGRPVQMVDFLAGHGYTHAPTKPKETGL